MKFLVRPKKTQIRTAVAVLVGAIALSSISLSLTSANSNPKFIQPVGVLVQIRNDQNQAAQSAILLGNSWIWLSPNLLAKANSPAVNLRNSADTLDVATAAGWLSQTYELQNLEAWTMDVTAITALVDLIGSVEVRPETDLQLESAGKPVMVLKQGMKTRLSGTAAGVYALSSTSAFEEVWLEVLRGLDAAYLPTVLPAIGAASRSTLEVSELIVLIEKIQANSVAGDFKFETWEGTPKLVQDQVFDVFSDAELAQLLAAGVVKRDS